MILMDFTQPRRAPENTRRTGRFFARLTGLRHGRRCSEQLHNPTGRPRSVDAHRLLQAVGDLSALLGACSHRLKPSFVRIPVIREHCARQRATRHWPEQCGITFAASHGLGLARENTATLKKNHCGPTL